MTHITQETAPAAEAIEAAAFRPATACSAWTDCTKSFLPHTKPNCSCAPFVLTEPVSQSMSKSLFRKLFLNLFWKSTIMYNWQHWWVFSGDFKGSLSWGGDRTIHQHAGRTAEYTAGVYVGEGKPYVILQLYLLNAYRFKEWSHGISTILQIKSFNTFAGNIWLFFLVRGQKISAEKH